MATLDEWLSTITKEDIDVEFERLKRLGRIQQAQLSCGTLTLLLSMPQILFEQEPTS